MQREYTESTDFSCLRYAQCWEDAEVLLKGLDVRPGDVCLSIASAGDNTLALLSRAPSRVIAVDLSPVQIACLELRVAAYRELSYQELLELMGSRPSSRREHLYRRCRGLLSANGRRFWDAHLPGSARGIVDVGKFEHYFALFRSRVMPLIHSKTHIERLLHGDRPDRRERFYDEEWDTWRWRLLFQIFFSRFFMARIGRDPNFFRYVDGKVAGPLLERARYALTALKPADNPYLQWILMGRHTTALPYALRPENFDSIREHLGDLEWHCCSVKEFLGTLGDGKIDRYNLSDIFEYMSIDDYHRHLDLLVRFGREGGRLAYWNMFVARRRPDHMANQLHPLTQLAAKLKREDKAFFYSAFILEEIV